MRAARLALPQAREAALSGAAGSEGDGRPHLPTSDQTAVDTPFPAWKD